MSSLEMKSRHTPIKGSLVRSFGLTGSEDLVVEMRDTGHVVIKMEPTDRRLKRGEKLPEVLIDVRGAWESRTVEEATPTDAVIDKLISRMPIAKFEEGPASTVDYRAKCWLMKQLKELKS